MIRKCSLIVFVFFSTCAMDRDIEFGEKPDICSICGGYLKGNLVTLPCGHSFHKSHLIAWRSVVPSKFGTLCPSCKEPYAIDVQSKHGAKREMGVERSGSFFWNYFCWCQPCSDDRKTV